jgi:RNA polymerase sigma factor (sigma-70 family)
MSAEDTGLPFDAIAILSGEPEPAPTVSASSLALTVKATMPSKARKYDTSRAVEELYRKHADSLERGEAAVYEKAAFGMYAIYKARIVKIARKYRSLSPIFGEEDLQQEALIAILQALRKYKHSPDIRMKFSTYLEWSIRNIFQRAIGSTDKYVEIYSGDGAFEKTMGYGKFVEQKKALEDEGCTYTTKKRFCYLSEVPWGEDLEGQLNQAGLAPYEYLAETPEKLAEMRETRTGEEPGEEEPHEELQISTSASGSRSRNGLDLRIIDGLYREWARRRPEASESDPVVLRIYDLCRQESEAFSLPSGNNGASVGDDEERAVLTAIARGLGRHDDGAVPHIPFSLFLRVQIKRSLEALRKRQNPPSKGGAPCVPEK